MAEYEIRTLGGGETVVEYKIRTLGGWGDGGRGPDVVAERVGVLRWVGGHFGVTYRGNGGLIGVRIRMSRRTKGHF